MKIILAILLTAFNFLNFAYASKWPTNLDGNYHCNSVEVDINRHYKGQMSLTKTGETYTVKMSFDDGSSYYGTGIYDQVKHVFSLAFINPHNPKETGVAISDIRKDYAHISKWTYVNKKSLSKAICIKA